MLYQVRAHIKGDVIGVGFRAWTKLQAKTLNVKGWVKNEFNEPEIFGQGGGVEALFQGSKNNVEQLVALVKQGPSVSYVEEADILWEKPSKVYDSFEIVK
jgi:acylphosphatase